ncbi:hypothetical protein VTH8203_01189 [Vibrio thalassae]|uniref:Uncharacterized protein n=1 Tax=Vibrio thalassae TaxID=1243014 RepID=A0A240EHB3_9VIBR|nr:hypothetical protein [Vibrio thalassae]SNX47579.1 hypothetical protein VTH8203_01189 [Vibrio thalassae]
MNKLLIIAIALQLALAFSSDGLTRALAELTAFLLTVVLFFNVKHAKLAQGDTKKTLTKLEKSRKSTTTL